MSVDRRDFLKAATVGAGGLTLAGTPLFGAVPAPVTDPKRRRSGQAPDVVVIGAGTFGMWTALNLVRLGVTVTVVDPLGPGNSRSTSGGETRGVRSSYGDRPHGMQWTRWANVAIQRWQKWDEEGKELLLPQVFFQTGDLIMRPEMQPYLETSAAQWDEIGVEHEILGPGEIRYRWPWFNTDAVMIDGEMTEPITTALYEPQAGVVRARRAIESVSKRFQMEGGELAVGRAVLGASNGRSLDNVTLEPEGALSGSTFIFALGPWFPKVFPEIFGRRMRTPLGHVFYFATPPGDTRFQYPNMPSYGVPGCTGWPALGPDNRGFRVRTGGGEGADPDTSERWIAKEQHERPRQILTRYFPDLAEQPVSETRACHYEFGISRNFVVDKHPDFDNVWLTGLGSAEAFKQGPVLGEYIAKRVLGIEDDPELAESFKIPEEEYEEGAPRRRG